MTFKVGLIFTHIANVNGVTRLSRTGQRNIGTRTEYRAPPLIYKLTGNAPWKAALRKASPSRSHIAP
jgi:hypothetical protein